jgi:Asp-tRNA(Asn)/Glu-tRNA(Gln) amidotransferase A subunit family amidase
MDCASTPTVLAPEALHQAVPTAAPRFADGHPPWQVPAKSFGEVLRKHARIFNLVHYPAMSIPCGPTMDGMSIGLQLAGRRLNEETLPCAAHAHEKAAGRRY